MVNTTTVEVAATLIPSRQCVGCPDTDTRLRVNDTMQFPWSAVGKVIRVTQGANHRLVSLQVQSPSHCR